MDQQSGWLKQEEWCLPTITRAFISLQGITGKAGTQWTATTPWLHQFGIVLQDLLMDLH
jgi:hypothetical protein